MQEGKLSSTVGKFYFVGKETFPCPKEMSRNFPGAKTRPGEIITQIIHENIVFFAQNPTYPA